jgi:hypothetical protein
VPLSRNTSLLVQARVRELEAAANSEAAKQRTMEVSDRYQNTPRLFSRIPLDCNKDEGEMIITCIYD